jgi:hypothetical protein
MAKSGYAVDDFQVKFIRFKFHIDQVAKLELRRNSVVIELLEFFRTHQPQMTIPSVTYIGRQVFNCGEYVSALTVFDSLRGSDSKFTRDNHDSDSLSGVVDSCSKLGQFDRLCKLLEQFLLDDPQITLQQRFFRAVRGACIAARTANSPQLHALEALESALRGYNSHIGDSLKITLSNITSLCRSLAPPLI